MSLPGFSHFSHGLVWLAVLGEFVSFVGGGMMGTEGGKMWNGMDGWIWV